MGTPEGAKEPSGFSQQLGAGARDAQGQRTLLSAPQMSRAQLPRQPPPAAGRVTERHRDAETERHGDVEMCRGHPAFWGCCRGQGGQRQKGTCLPTTRQGQGRHTGRKSSAVCAGRRPQGAPEEGGHVWGVCPRDPLPQACSGQGCTHPGQTQGALETQPAPSADWRRRSTEHRALESAGAAQQWRGGGHAQLRRRNGVLEWICIPKASLNSRFLSGDWGTPHRMRGFP